MSDNVSHLGYFPFCVGYEPTFLFRVVPLWITTGFNDPPDPAQNEYAGYDSVLKIKLKDAVALYWKAKKARLQFNMSYNGLLPSEIDYENYPPPFYRKPQLFTLNVDEEIDFYTTDLEKKEQMKKRVCFDIAPNVPFSPDQTEPFLSYSSAVSGGGIFNIYISFFDTTYGVFDYNNTTSNTVDANRVFLDTEKPNQFTPNSLTGWWPYISPEDDVYVNMYFIATHANGTYSDYLCANAPHLMPEFGNESASSARRKSFLSIKINDNTYQVELQNKINFGIEPVLVNYNLEILT